MKDLFDREISYLRISVTDLCNLRCRYCMPPEDIAEKEHNDILSEDEIILVIKAASELGINKIRFTGGEPLLKKNIVSICRRTSEVKGINEICLTTNGILLPKFAAELKNSGVSRVNISLDTLKPEKYFYITNGGSLDKVLEGINCAEKSGFTIKINTVLIKNFNDDEIPELIKFTQSKNIDLRFIELMPMLKNFPGEFIANSKILKIIPDLEYLGIDGVAKIYKLRNSLGRIGFISPMSELFCSKCNRIRLTSDGFIKPCLHSDAEFFIRNKTKDEIKSAIIQAIKAKPERHFLNLSHHSKSQRTMNKIGG